jgi:hypothetical protein
MDSSLEIARNLIHFGTDKFFDLLQHDFFKSLNPHPSICFDWCEEAETPYPNDWGGDVGVFYPDINQIAVLLYKGITDCSLTRTIFHEMIHWKVEPDKPDHGKVFRTEYLKGTIEIFEFSDLDPTSRKSVEVWEEPFIEHLRDKGKIKLRNKTKK